MKLSIIIVNYNVTQLLTNCLLSIQQYVEVDHEVIVVDNASTDDSWKSLITKFPEFHFIASSENEGFAKANNKAVKTAKGEYILLLNPDTEVEGAYMKDILDFADANKENFGCLGVRMHDAKGNFLPESKRSVPDMFNSFEKLFTNFKKNNSKSYYRNDIGEYTTTAIDVVTGAFLLIKKEVYEKIGGLDETYFMYGEDIDLCYTLLKKGYKNFYYGKASILHHKGESTVKDEVYLERFYGAMQVFINKYYRDAKPMQYSFLKAGLSLRHKIEKIKLK